MIDIEIIQGNGDAIFQSYMLQNHNTLIYSSPNFINLVTSHLNAEPNWVVARKGSEILGILPYIVKSGPLGPIYNSLAYYGSNGGVIQKHENDQIKRDIIEKFFSQAKLEESASATIITNPLEQDADLYEEVTQYDCRDERIGQITHLPQDNDPDNLIKLFQAPRPRNIRRALKEGVSINIGHTESLDFLPRQFLRSCSGTISCTAL